MFEKKIETKNLCLCLITTITYKEYSGLMCDFKFKQSTYRVCRKKSGLFYDTYIDVLNNSEYKFWKDGSVGEDVIYNSKSIPFNESKVKVSDIIKYVNGANAKTYENSNELEK